MFNSDDEVFENNQQEEILADIVDNKHSKNDSHEPQKGPSRAFRNIEDWDETSLLQKIFRIFIGIVVITFALILVIFLLPLILIVALILFIIFGPTVFFGVLKTLLSPRAMRKRFRLFKKYLKRNAKK